MYSRTLLFIFLIIFLISCGGGNGVPNPEITGIQPTSGPPGSMVTISGKDFSPKPASNTVTFGGMIAEITGAAESQLQATVPELDPGPAQVEITVGQASASGPSFTVEREAPGISAVEPDSGTVGTEVTITGMNFSPNLSENNISFNGMDALINSASETQLITEVPDGATDGPIEVTVGEKATTGPDFDVITEGALKVLTSTTGSSQDTDGYQLVLNDNFKYSVNVNDEKIITGLQKGEYAVSFENIAANCTADNTNPAKVTIAAGDTTSAAFEITCKKAIKNKIVFRSNPDAPNGDYDIYSINPDGTGQQKLFDTPQMESFPEVSNDGTQLTFRQWSNSGNELYIANADGTEITELTNLPDYIFTASFSPDDSKIVFSSGTEDDSEIYIIDSDGSGLTQLTDDNAWNRYPEWSPEGSKILFDSNIDGDFEIYTMDTNGSNVQKLTDDAVRNSGAKWSPDGNEIIFSSKRDGIYGDIYRMNADGTNVRRITTNNGGATNPEWSPDGLKIVFKDNRELFILNSDGTGSATQITSNPNTNSNQIGVPDWSPIGN